MIRQLFHFFLEDVDEGVERDRAEVFLVSGSQRDLFLLHLFVAYHHHIGHFIQLCVAYLIVDFFGSAIHLRADASVRKRLFHSLAIIIVTVGDRQDGDLDRRQPGRECARVMFDQDTHKPFERAEDGAMDHHRSVFLVILTLSLIHISEPTRPY